VQGDQYYRVRDKFLYAGLSITQADRVESCWPQTITDAFYGVATPVRTAFWERSTGQIFFFSSNNYTTNNDKYTDTSFLDRLYQPHTSSPITSPVSCVSGLPVAALPVPTSTYHAIFQRDNGKIYIFQGIYYWRITDQHYTPLNADCLDNGYPQITNSWFPGLPGTPDAVFQRSNGLIYFFVGLQYYRFSDKYITGTDPTLPDVPYGSALNITDFGIPAAALVGASVAGAFQRPNGKIYIFLRVAGAVSVYRITDHYLTDTDLDVVDPGYPKPLSSVFEDIGPTFDTVFQRVRSNQDIYFFTGNTYTLGSDQYIDVPGHCTACTLEVSED